MTAILVSIHGRDVGLDVNRNLTARVGLKVPNVYVGTSGSEALSDIEGISTVTNVTTSSTVSARGTALATTSTAAEYTLAAPVAGVRKQLVLNTTTTSTGARTFTLVSGNFQSTASSTYTTLTLNGPGQSAQLLGISTARYQVLSMAAAAVLA